MDIESIIAKLKNRAPDAHKGDFGRVFVIAGATGLTGAAYMAAAAALRVGAGRVTLALPKSLNTILEVKLTCEMTLPMPENEVGTFSKEAFHVLFDLVDKYDVMALGPGIDVNEDTIYLVSKVLSEIDKPTVLDADGLNCLAKDLSVLDRKRNSPLILTPHPGEFLRLTGVNTKSDKALRQKSAKEFSQKTGCITVLKGHKTIVTDGEQVYINNTGNPGMATAGTGDVLTGMITGFLAQGISAFEAAVVGVYLHGKAGDAAQKKFGTLPMIATDILDCIKDVLK